MTKVSKLIFLASTWFLQLDEMGKLFEAEISQAKASRLGEAQVIANLRLV